MWGVPWSCCRLESSMSQPASSCIDPLPKQPLHRVSWCREVSPRVRSVGCQCLTGSWLIRCFCWPFGRVLLPKGVCFCWVVHLHLFEVGLRSGCNHDVQLVQSRCSSDSGGHSSLWLSCTSLVSSSIWLRTQPSRLAGTDRLVRWEEGRYQGFPRWFVPSCRSPPTWWRPRWVPCSFWPWGRTQPPCPTPTSLHRNSQAD